MPVSDRVAILLDGEFVKKALGGRLKRFPGHADVMAEVTRVLASPCLAAYSLYRVFYYTAEPLCRTAAHPLDWPDAEGLMENALTHRSRGVIKLDPAVRARGRMSRRWGLWVNVGVGQGER